MFLGVLLLTLTACAVGPYADTPTYKLAETRTTAARQLNEALAFDAIGVSEVAADELKLTWHEYRNITAKRKQLIDRERPLVSAGLGSPSLDLGDQAAHRALGLALGAPHQP